MSVQREDFSRFRYGVRVDAPEVRAALATLRAMLPERQAEWLQSFACGYVAFQRTGDMAILTEVALDAVATMRMHRNPAYVAALDAMPDEPVGPGRAVEDIFRELRDGVE